MEVVTTVMAINAGATSIDIPTNNPSIARLLGVTLIELTTDGSTVTANSYSATASLTDSRTVSLETNPSNNALAVVVYEPAITFERVTGPPGEGGL